MDDSSHSVKLNPGASAVMTSWVVCVLSAINVMSSRRPVRLIAQGDFMRREKCPVATKRVSRLKPVHHPAYRAMIRRLVEARKRRRLTQARVARVFFVHRQWVSKIENFEVCLDVISLLRLCRVYHIRTAELVTWMEKKLPPSGSSFFCYCMGWPDDQRPQGACTMISVVLAF